MLEYIIILAVLLFIAVLFYKQANEQFEILQIDAERLSDLPTVYQDRSPIVVSGFPTPTLGTESELQKRDHIMQMQTKGISLRSLLASPAIKTFTFPKASAEFLCKESGLNIWFEHHLYKSLLPSPYTSWIYSFNTSLWPDHRGLFKTTAFQTLLMPTQGTAIVTLMLPTMLPYLPTKWGGRLFSSLTMQDTPLLNQLQFIEIKIRKGNLLLLPAHLIVNIHSEVKVSETKVSEVKVSEVKAQDTNAWVFVAEIHHPISRLA